MPTLVTNAKRREHHFHGRDRKRLRDDLVHYNQELETAYEELQSTNEELQTTNEELQSTIEELETTNEELQSTNEELETMNEELQSTNEEMETLNDELRRRTGELDEARFFSEALTNSIQLGLVVLDREMRVISWNHGCENMWGLRSGEAVGHPLGGLDIGLPVDDLKPLIGNAFVDPDAAGEISLEAVNRRGRHVVVRVACSSFHGADGTVNGALLLMEEAG